MRYNWPMSAHASQAFSIAHCTDSEDLPKYVFNLLLLVLYCLSVHGIIRCEVDQNVKHSAVEIK